MSHRSPTVCDRSTGNDRRTLDDDEGKIMNNAKIGRRTLRIMQTVDDVGNETV